VNFELPNVSEDYVHRIGRTGRADRQGTAISLVCIDERELLKDIERLLKYTIPEEVIEGYEPDPSVRAEPIFKGRNDSNQRQGGNRQLRKPSRGSNSPKRPTGRKYAEDKECSPGHNGENRCSRPRNA
jgi:ATP-dependent RNA helicase RhlE